MRFVSAIEKFAIEKGMEDGIQIGMQQGLQQGLQQGRVEVRLDVLRRLLQRRFGQLPAWAESRLTTATEADLEAWTDAVIDAENLSAVLGAPGT